MKNLGYLGKQIISSPQTVGRSDMCKPLPIIEFMSSQKLADVH